MTSVPIRDSVPAREAFRAILARLPSRAKLHEWITRGAVAADGRRVRLRAWRLGNNGHWMTTEQTAADFIQAILVSGGEGASVPAMAGAAGE